MNKVGDKRPDKKVCCAMGPKGQSRCPSLLTTHDGIQQLASTPNTDSLGLWLWAEYKCRAEEWRAWNFELVGCCCSSVVRKLGRDSSEQARRPHDEFST